MLYISAQGIYTEWKLMSENTNKTIGPVWHHCTLTTRPASSLFNRTRSRRGPDLRPGGGAILLGTKSAWASPCKCWHYSHVPLNNYIVWIHLLGGFIYLLAFLVCCLRKVQLDHITLAVLLNSDHSNAHFRFFRGSLLQHTQFKRSSLTCMQNLY